MDVPFLEKVSLILQIKQQAVSEMSSEYAGEYINIAPELQAFYQQILQTSLAAFMSFIKKAQVRGEVRQDLRPEFFLTVVQKMLELGRDEEFIRLGELIIEVNKFLYYGILPQPESEQK